MQFSILSWNIQGKRHLTRTSFKKVVPALEALTPDILCLQEAHEAREKLHQLDSFRAFSHVLPKRGNNHNVIVSRFPVQEYGELDFPRLSARSLERSLWATLEVGEKRLRVYNCHFGPVVRVSPAARARQLQVVVEHAEQHNGPVIICGDLNTTTPQAGLRRKVMQLLHLMPEGAFRVDGEYFTDDERYVFARIAERSGFREVTDLSQSTWRVAPLQWEFFNMKLDWLLVRDIDTPNVTLHPYISDHKAIHADCVLR